MTNSIQIAVAWADMIICSVIDITFRVLPWVVGIIVFVYVVRRKNHVG